MGSVALAVAIIIGWQELADARIVSPVYMPGPDRVWSALAHGFESGELGPKIGATLGRMVLGWFLASLLGIALGALIGISPALCAYFAPSLEFLRPLPASAVIPAAIALLGLSDGMVVAVIGFGALWPMLLATVHGFAAVEPRLYDVSRVLGLTNWEIIRKIALPSALPDILAGLRLGITVALILAVVGEMLASRGGLGQWILLAARSFRAADLFAGIVVLGLIGFVSAQLIGLLEDRLLQWRGSK